jgi:trehalose 6-phosphate phosphatase
MSLDQIRARLASALVMLDFDGSLAPIVEDPAEARPLPEAVEVLTALAPRVGRLVVVTGRPSDFVQDRLPVPRLEVVGLYGSEGAPPVDAAVRRSVATVAATQPGAHVEDKGAAIVVHLRRTEDPDGATARLRVPLSRAAAVAGLVLLEGKMVLELAPPGEGKGGALRRLADGMAGVLVAGDDLADVAAFDAAALAEASGLVVCRVAVGGLETPIELIERADLTVEGPWGLLELLRSL